MATSWDLFGRLGASWGHVFASRFSNMLLKFLFEPPKCRKKTSKGLQKRQIEQKMSPKWPQVMPERTPKGLWCEGVAGDAPQALSIRPPHLWGFRPCKTITSNQHSLIIDLKPSHGPRAFRRAAARAGANPPISMSKSLFSYGFPIVLADFRSSDPLRRLGAFLGRTRCSKIESICSKSDPKPPT